MALQPGLVGLRKISAGLLKVPAGSVGPGNGLQDFALHRSLHKLRGQNYRSSPPLRRVPAQIAPAQWAVGNVLFPTRLRCRLFAKFCLRSLKFAPLCKSKSLGRFSGVSGQGVACCKMSLLVQARFFRLCRAAGGGMAGCFG